VKLTLDPYVNNNTWVVSACARSSAELLRESIGSVILATCVGGQVKQIARPLTETFQFAPKNKQRLYIWYKISAEVTSLEGASSHLVGVRCAKKHLSGTRAERCIQQLTFADATSAFYEPLLIALSIKSSTHAETVCIGTKLFLAFECEGCCPTEFYMNGIACDVKSF
jgi:hypothetical protein